MTSQLNVALIHKLRVSFMCLPHLFNVLSFGVCTTRHCQTSGRMVQQLTVCTVGVNNQFLNNTVWINLALGSGTNQEVYWAVY